MASTVANLSTVMKDVWTSDRLAKQFYNKFPLMEWFNSYAATMIGLQAQVPIHKGRNAGLTTTSVAGGALNPATNQVVDQAIYTMVQQFGQIALEWGAMNQTAGNAVSIVNAKDFEVSGIIDDMSMNYSRQLTGNGDGIICQCTTGGASTTVNLLPAASGGLGSDMIVRQGLYVGMPVDIGTAGDSDSLVTASAITAIDPTPTAPTITIGTSITTSSSHFVSWANPNSATATSPEVNGLRNLFGSNTSIVGGINPATAGNEYWKPASVDSATTSLSIDLLLNLTRFVYQQTGSTTTPWLFGAKQMMNLYSLLQNQVRYTGERGLGAGGIGNMDGITWNGMGINVWPQLVDKEIYAIDKDSMVRIKGKYDQPVWQSDVGGTGGMTWTKDTTAFYDMVGFATQVGVSRRNTSASATNLVA